MPGTPPAQKPRSQKPRPKSPRLSLISVVALWGVLGVADASADTAAAAPPSARLKFNRDIRPLLSDRCFACHGPDDKRREGDLRLDTREGATHDAGDGAAIAPGHPERSRLLERILSDDPDERMPPPSAKKPPFTDEETARLKRWIAEGAEYEGHWALLPVAQPTLPVVSQLDRLRNPIDAFIVERLNQESLEPSPQADRATLLRRVYLDFTGLPPSPEQLDEFLADEGPDAFERMVDRALHSPHYGERWGRHWLDHARYADSNGYSVDGEREMWPYRDWVIQAFNRDLPFDRFTVEQLAGDLLPGATKEQLVATAFHRNTLINQEGGVDREQFRNEAMMDRVNTTGAVWLGLTVGCAQCHSHKYDPLSQREYYQLAAFFNSAEDANDRGPVLEVARGEVFLGRPARPEPPEPPTLAGAELVKVREAWEAAERLRLETLLASEPSTPVVWKPVEYREAQTTRGESLKPLGDGTLLAELRAPAHDEYRIRATSSLPRVAAIRLRTLVHPSLPKNGPGKASNGNFVLSRVEAWRGTERLKIASAFADHEQPKFPVAGVLDDDPQTGWAINVGPQSTSRMNADHEAVFVLAAPIMLGDDEVELRLRHEVHADYLIGRLAIEVSETAPAPPKSEIGAAAALREALRKPEAARTDAEKQQLQAAFEQAEPRAKKPPKKPRPDVAQLMIMRDRSAPRDTFLLTRGDFTRPDKTLGPLVADVPQAIAPKLAPSPAAAARPTRLDLARWLVDPANPLPSRVLVNRFWMRLFGRGLVETEEDLGTQGAPPSHPELLDWLATDLMRRGWSVKQLQRTIATSATYRQSSRARADLGSRDPRNMLWGRQERLRVEGEIVRDAALAASGLLDRAVGGPSVRPPQPEGVYAFTQTVKAWNAATGGDRYRRGLYTFFYRSAPYPLLTTFDSPDFQQVCTRRVRSNTPLQSLTLANDEAFVELARGLAQRLAAEAGGDDDRSGENAPSWQRRIRQAYRLSLSREPSAKELDVLTAFGRRQEAAYATDLEAARQLAGDIASVPPPTAAALVAVARAILNSDNFITRE
ncbi:MAG: PSD1 and planctomycete cytochrome C domain-containing protein [Pirellulales bacterium]